MKSTKHNVIMFNVEEQTDDDASRNHNADVALEFMNSTGFVQCEGEFSVVVDSKI